MMRKEQRFVPFFWLVKTKAKTTRERNEEAQSFHILAGKKQELLWNNTNRKQTSKDN
jgi:hypothetical protein